MAQGKKHLCKVALMVIEGLFYPEVFFDPPLNDKITRGQLTKVGKNKVFTEEIAEQIDEEIIRRKKQVKKERKTERNKNKKPHRSKREKKILRERNG